MSILPTADDIFGNPELAKQMKQAGMDYGAAMNLMAHPMAGYAAFSALGMGVAGHMMGLMAGAMTGAMEASRKLPQQPSDMPDMMSSFWNWSLDVAPAAGADDAAVVERAEQAPTPEQPAAEAILPPMETPAPPETESAEPVTAAAPPVGEALELMPEDFVKPAAIEKPAEPDDLKLISGIGPKLEQVLNGLGVWTFAQIAAWTPEEIAWVDDYLQFKGRIDRDEWIPQAEALRGSEAMSA